MKNQKHTGRCWRGAVGHSGVLLGELENEAKQTVKRNKVAKEINQIATEEVNDFWINTSDAIVKKWIFDEE